MATYYVSTSGSDSNGGTNDTSDAWLTVDHAMDTAPDGSDIVVLDGEYTESLFNASNNVSVASDSFRGATLKASGGQANRTLYFGTGYTSANDPIIYSDIILDGDDETARVVEVAGSTGTEHIRLNNVVIKNGTGQQVLINKASGRQEFYNVKFSGALTSNAIAGSSFANSGDQTLEIDGLVMDNLTAWSMTADEVINLTKGSANPSPATTFNSSVRGITGTFTGTNTDTYRIVQIRGADYPVVTECDFTFNKDASTESYIIFVSGLDATNTTTDALIAGNIIRANMPNGFVIALGESQSSSNHITGGTISGNCVTGKYYSAATPHNYILGEDSTGKMVGNVSRHSFVGYLASRTESGAEIRGNLAVDCYGSSYYAKGTAAVDIVNNTAVVSNKFPQLNIGILSCAKQGTVDTTAATFDGNTVIVQDVSNIAYLADTQDVNQVCTYQNNRYIIPDSVDLTSADLFRYQGTANTFSEWQGNTSDTEQIIQLPQGQIDALVRRYQIQAANAAGIRGDARAAIQSAVG